MTYNIQDKKKKIMEDMQKNDPDTNPMLIEVQAQYQTLSTISKLANLVLDTKGNPRMCDENLIKILNNDEEFAGSIRYNSFQHKIEVRKQEKGKEVWEAIADHTPIDMMCYIQRHYSPFFTNTNKGKMQDAIMSYAYSNSVNPLQEYLKKIVWDEVPRIDRWLQETYKADDDEYTKKVGSNFMKALVKRVMEPGCKVDHVMVLEGNQGVGKSSSLAILGMGYHVETTINTENKDFFLIMRGKTIVEFSEGETLSRATVNQLKSIITTQIDTYRPPYGREQVDYPRGCIFAMTTNSASYLKDETGNRRWLPIECHDTANLTWLRENVEQLYAEAYHRVEVLKEDWWHIPKEVAEEKQDARMEHSEYFEQALEWLYTKNGTNWREDGVSAQKLITDVLFKGFHTAKWDRRDEMMASSIFKRDLKMDRKQRLINGVRVWRYYPSRRTPKYTNNFSIESEIISTEDIPWEAER